MFSLLFFLVICSPVLIYSSP